MRLYYENVYFSHYINILSISSNYKKMFKDLFKLNKKNQIMCWCDTYANLIGNI